MSEFAASAASAEQRGALSFVPTGTATVEALQNKYVLIGAPSESGLGQIATEAIYHTLLPKGQIQRVGFLKSTLLTPIAGCESYSLAALVMNPSNSKRYGFLSIQTWRSTVETTS